MNPSQARQLIPSPPVQVIGGSALMLQRGGLVLAARFIEYGIKQHELVNGIHPSADVKLLLALTTEAVAGARAEIERGRLDVQAKAPRAHSKEDAIGATEAAEILGCSRRHITRIATSLNGWGGGKGKAWRFSRAEIYNYKETENG